MNENIPGCLDIIVAAGTVRKDKPLFGYIDKVHEVDVNDEPAAKADESLSVASKLRPYDILDLTQLVGNYLRMAVLSVDMAVIVLGRYIYQPIYGNS